MKACTCIRFIGLALGLLLPARAHFVFQTNDGTSTSLTFSENGQPGVAPVLEMIAPVVSGWAQASTDQKSVRYNLSFAYAKPARSSLIAALPSRLTSPYALESFAPYGIFSEGDSLALLQYYSSAAAITTPNDWFEVQDALSNRFEITIRDPYMDTNTTGDVTAKGMADAVAAMAWESSSVLATEDQCDAGFSTEDGDACVVAVIRLDGELPDDSVAETMSVTTFDGDSGDLISTADCGACGGVLILKVPMNDDGSPRRVFAKVQYIEMVNGTFSGEAYDYVDHWATTSADIVRPASSGR